MRPTKGQSRRSAHLIIRIEPAVKESIQKAAKSAGMTVADFVALHCLKAIKEE